MTLDPTRPAHKLDSQRPWLRRWRWRLLGGSLLGAGALSVALWLGSDDETVLRTAPLVKGDLVETVTSTGVLEAVETVEVGTQVSGVIQELRVDYNDHVEAGQVMAIIDPTLAEADVRSAQAQLSLRYAEYERDAAALARLQELVKVGAATRAELEAAESSAKTSAAQSRAARIALERAERNLQYTTITSPVTGTVLSRDVDAGQTVNAGMSAPRLFVVAGDLSQMQILATVDEADIGQLHPGQRVEFTVQAWPDQRFVGAVDKVRLQSTLTDNVVTYTVVVAVDNQDERLLPGMTANVEFVVGEARDVWVVPNAALRYRPDAASAGSSASGRPEGSAGRSGGGQGRAGQGRAGQGKGQRGIWVQAADGTLSRLPVETGLSDGKLTEVRGDGLTEGLQVVIGVQSAESATRTSNSPFQSQPQRGGWPRGGF